jgi:hypothetical protein
VARRKSGRKRKTPWTLKHLKVEVNLLVAKIGLLFSKDEPRPIRKARVRKAQRIVRAEYQIIQAEAPGQRQPVPRTVVAVPNASIAPSYPVFGVDEFGRPLNLLGETVAGLAGQRRVQAIRDGDSGTAIAAAIIEQVVVDSARKQNRRDDGQVRWN